MNGRRYWSKKPRWLIMLEYPEGRVIEYTYGGGWTKKEVHDYFTTTAPFWKIISIKRDTKKGKK